MVGVVIGLLASLAVTQVLVTSEGQKRTTAAGSESQVNGALALAALQRALMSAGYGFSSSRPVIGCELRTRFNNLPAPGLPTSLVPLVITDGAAGAPDSIRVIASGKDTYSLPLRVVTPYAAGNTSFQVASVLSIADGDFMVATRAANQPCEMFRVTSAPAGSTVPRADAPGAWNPVGFPAEAYGIGSVLVNLGPEPLDVTYRISGDSLRATTLRIAGNGTPSYEGPVELFPDIVNLQAFYGKDSDANGTVDTWDTATPTDNAGWLRVTAVRLAVVVRSPQMEAEDVTQANPEWDVGASSGIAGTVACGSSQCLPLPVSHLPNWKRYRYRVFDTTVPLRNMLWSS